jgi:signal transduction histidine kinase
MSILFANQSFKREIDENPEGQICWQVLKAGYTKECERCPKMSLFDENHRIKGNAHIWEDYNPITKRWYNIASMALEWVDGRMAIMELAVDNTDQKLVEIELVRAREKAEESDKLKSSFLANMSHEIRPPLNGIVGLVQLLESDTLSYQERCEYIGIINVCCAQLIRLIDDIIDLSKIEAKQLNINPVRIQINSLMEELHIFFETYMRSNNKGHIMLILDRNEFIDNNIVHVDSIRLRQVLTNLINNAIKFTEKGHIRFGYRQLSPGKLEFIVEDTGIGLKPEHKDVIFERFRQLQFTNNRQYEGAGLGLPISRNLAKLMGGDLWLESVEGEGATFYFTITDNALVNNL